MATLTDRVAPAAVREAAVELIRRLESIAEAKAAAFEQARALADLAEIGDFVRLYHVIPQEARGILEDLGPDQAVDPEHVADETHGT